VFRDDYKTATRIQFRRVGQKDPLSAFIHRVIDECNYRSLFNITVSNALRLPYLPNSFRLPFRKFYFRKATIAQKYIASLREIEKEYQNLADLYLVPEQNNLQLPFFLSAILERISSPDEFLEVLMDVRDKAETFRKHRAQLDEALETRSVKEVKMLREALQEDSAKLRPQFPYAPVAGGIAAVLAAFTGQTTPFLLATIFMFTAASQFSREDMEKLKNYALMRRFWLLLDLKDSAQGLTNALPKIRQLWGVKDVPNDYSEEAFVEHFRRLASLGY
jgi:hypothetical protein